MEVAGLVLGVYPAVVLAFEQFKTGKKYFSNWVQFRRKYEELMQDIEAQRLRFQEVLFNIMCGGRDPYLKHIDNDMDAFLEMISSKSFRNWKDPELKTYLEIRLGDKYDWFRFTIDRINSLLGDFEELLRIEGVSLLLFFIQSLLNLVHYLRVLRMFTGY